MNSPNKSKNFHIQNINLYNIIRNKNLKNERYSIDCNNKKRNQSANTIKYRLRMNFTNDPLKSRGNSNKNSIQNLKSSKKTNFIIKPNQIINLNLNSLYRNTLTAKNKNKKNSNFNIFINQPRETIETRQIGKNIFEEQIKNLKLNNDNLQNELTQLKSQLENQMKLNNEYKIKENDLINLNNKYLKQINYLEQNIKQKDNEIKILKNNIENNDNEKIKEYQNVLEEKEIEIKNLKKNIDDNNIQLKNKEKEELEKQIKLNNENKLLKEELINIKKINEQIQREINELKEKNKEKDNEINMLKKLNKNEEYEKLLKQIQKENNDLKQRNNNIEIELSKRQKDLEKQIELNKEYKSKEKKLVDMNQKIEQLQKQINYLETENNQKNEKIKSLEKNNKNEIDNITKKYQKDLNEKDNEIKTLKQIKINYENELQKKNKDKISLNSIKEYNKPTLIGLNDIGAPSFINATLQCLSQTKELTNYFLNDKNKNILINNNISLKNKIFYNQLSPIYLELIHKLWAINESNSFSPYNFMNMITAVNPLFKTKEASQIKDFIIFILGQLHEELKKPIIINNNNNLNEPLNQYDKKNTLNHFFNEFKKECSIISDIFFGFTQTNYECMNCKNIYNSQHLNNPVCYNYGIFNCLIFPLEEIKNIKNSNNFINDKNAITLNDCFYYNQKKNLTVQCQRFCNICKQICDTIYTPRIFVSPNVLVLILDRGKRNIYDLKIDFKETLDITQFVLQKDMPQITYNLYGVISYIYQNTPNPHFVASCKSPIDDKWYLYDNDTVTPIYNFDRQIDQNGTPYMFFYQKK